MVSSRLALATVGCALVLAGCASDLVTGKTRFARDQWTPQEEREQAATFAPNLIAQGAGVATDRELHAYLDELVYELGRQSIRKDVRYRLTILQDVEPLLYSLPDGSIFLSRGLLADLDIEAQFALFVASEIAHIEHRHAMFGHSRNLVAGAARALLGQGRAMGITEAGVGPWVAAVARSDVAPRVTLRMTLDDEKEADVRACRIAYDAGYDPREIRRNLDLQRRYLVRRNAPQLIATHPFDESRVRDNERHLRRTYPNILRRAPRTFRGSPSDSAPFREHIDSVRDTLLAFREYAAAVRILETAAVGSPTLAEARLRIDTALEQLPAEPLFIATSAEVDFAQGVGDSGRAQFEQAIMLDQRSGSAWPLWRPAFYLGVLAHRAEEPGVAVEHFGRSNELYPLHPLSRFWRGLALLDLGDRDSDALTAFQQVTELVPEESVLAQESRVHIAALTIPVEGLAPTDDALADPLMDPSIDPSTLGHEPSTPPAIAQESMHPDERPVDPPMPIQAEPLTVDRTTEPTDSSTSLTEQDANPESTSEQTGGALSSDPPLHITGVETTDEGATVPSTEETTLPTVTEGEAEAAAATEEGADTLIGDLERILEDIVDDAETARDTDAAEAVEATPPLKDGVTPPKITLREIDDAGPGRGDSGDESTEGSTPPPTETTDSTLEDILREIERRSKEGEGKGKGEGTGGDGNGGA